VLIVDDLLATGGTLLAASSLVQQAGGVVEECFVLMELGFLKARDKFPESAKISSLVVYDEE
jgi:adenine phosphoribosyltransferase